jgi:hypothetical protein
MTLANLKDRVSKDEMIMQASFSLSMAFEETTRIIRGLNSLAQHRISPDLVLGRHMTAALILLQKNMEEEGYTFGAARYDDLYRCETSHLILDSGLLMVIIHLPAYEQDSMLRLMEYIPVPMVFRRRHSEEEKASAKSGGLEVHEYHETSFLVEPRERLLAMKDDETAFKVMSKEELNECTSLAGVHFCGNTNVYDQRKESSCIVGLYTRDAKIIGKTCVWKREVAKDYALQLGAEIFLLYHAFSAPIDLRCGEQVTTTSVVGLVQVRVPAGCRLYARSYILDGQKNFLLSVSPYVQRRLDFQDLLSKADIGDHEIDDSLSGLSLVGSDEGLTIEELKDRYSAITATTIAIISMVLFLLVGVRIRRYWIKKNETDGVINWCAGCTGLGPLPAGGADERPEEEEMQAMNQVPGQVAIPGHN